ncbi:unnamed protein product [Microthlaspi erraticum]|nr:unnamed protein product [Microthlaspi erraticum]
MTMVEPTVISTTSLRGDDFHKYVRMLEETINFYAPHQSLLVKLFIRSSVPPASLLTKLPSSLKTEKDDRQGYVCKGSGLLTYETLNKRL